MKPTLLFASSVGASFLTATLCVLGFQKVQAADPSDGTDPGLRAELDRLDGRLDSLLEQLTEPSGDAGAGASAELLATLGELRLRVDRIEDRARRQPATGQVAEGTAEPSDASSDSGGGSRAGADVSRDEFIALLGPVLSGDPDVSPEDQARFWEAARSSGLVDDLVGTLEAALDDNPTDVDTRLELANAYVAKLLTVPAGPERGVWGSRAEEQWETALELDPMSWDAQFRLAESLSYYPAFLNKRGEAIEGLEAARRIQEELVPESRHAKTYLLLSRMHVQGGDREAALLALRAGLARHPGDAELAQALDEIEGL